ncbi:hypothetical protein [Lentzea albida]|uniref:Protein kinase n=1 Tax=Lentzea albida TaxID=65499 RepID=A0A1H9LLS6_9PSEU|nr:hypothetical protein [Lentzea albida]SER12386.1 hypothetical protein SAMN04488000_106174 [Lentzea albida]
MLAPDFEVLEPARAQVPGAVPAAVTAPLAAAPPNWRTTVEPLPPVVTVGPEVPPRRRPPWLAIGFALVALTAGGIGFGLGRATGPDLLRSAGTTSAAPSTSSSPDVFTVVGSMTVNGSCGSGGYSDVRLGGQVEIVNQDNEVLAVGTLLGGAQSCTFNFAVSGVPKGERLYGAKIGNANRGVIWKTQQAAEAEGFHLTLG